MLTRPAPSPLADEAGYLAHSLGLARCIAGPGYPFDKDAQREQIRAETRRAWHPAGLAGSSPPSPPPATSVQSWPTSGRPLWCCTGATTGCSRRPAARISPPMWRAPKLMLIDGMGHDVPPALYRQVGDAIAALAARSGG